MNIRSTHLASLSLLGLVSCASPQLIEAWSHRSTELITINPNDVAVLKVEDASPGAAAAAVLDYMRVEIEKALIKRNYAPLGSSVVDAHLRSDATPGASIVDAAFLKEIASKAKEDAIFAVRIKRWDPSTLLTNDRVRFEADAALFGSSTGKILWSCGLRGEVIAGGGRAAPRDPLARARAAALELVREIVGRVPRRKT